MQEIVLDIINQFGYIGVFLLMIIEGFFPPIPSEVILTFGGFLTTYTDMSAWLTVAAATFGSMVGAIVLYAVGRLLNAERIARFIDSKVGHRLRLKREDLSKAEGWFARQGNKAVFFCRFIPVIRSLISIPAGMARIKPGIFLLLTGAGTSMWNTALIFLGRAAGNAWETIARYFDTYTLIILIVLILAVIILGVVFLKRRFFK